MTLFDILDWIWYGFTAVIFLPLFLGLKEWRQLNRREHRLIIFLFSLLMAELVGTVLRFSLIRNHFIHYYVTLAVLWIAVTFYVDYSLQRRFLQTAIFFIALAIPVEIFLVLGFNQINTVTETIAWFTLALLAFINLKYLVVSPDITSLRENSLLYYHLGFFIIGFFRAGKACFVKYFIETSLDLYFFMDTLVVMGGAIAYGLFARGIRMKNA